MLPLRHLVDKKKTSGSEVNLSLHTFMAKMDSAPPLVGVTAGAVGRIH